MGGCFVTGTDTEVGKTVVTAALTAAALQHDPSRTYRVWKPVQTGMTLHDRRSDAMRLLRGSGIVQSMADTVTYSYEDGLAPWMAAERCGQAISFQKLVDEGRRHLRESDVLFAEGAGGWLVPLTEQHVIGDLVVALHMPVLLVARAGVGTVNHTVLTIQAIQRAQLPVIGVILNGMRPEMERIVEENVRMIERFGGVRVLGVLPWQDEEPSWDDSREGAMLRGQWFRRHCTADGWLSLWTACIGEQVTEVEEYR